MAGPHVKKNDVVVVLSGAAKGKSGKVLSVDRQAWRVIVEGVNVRKKAVRRSQANPQGGIIEKEAPLPLAKVMLQSEYEARRARKGLPVAAAGAEAKKSE